MLVLILLSATANAQSVQVDLDKKTIFTDSLNLPGNTSAYSMLTMLPELLQRPGTTFLSNYDIQIEDMSVNETGDVALNQLMIDDIEKIEVSESPLSSYNKNGVGGCINIVLREHGKHGDRLWGSAGIQVSHPSNIAPQFILGHRSSTFMVRGVFMSDIFNYPSSSETINYNAAGKLTGSTRADNYKKYRSQVARLYMLYEPNQNDAIKFNVSQTYSYSKDYSTPQYETELKNITKDNATNLHSLLNYTHKWNESQFVIEAQYQYSPGSTFKYVPKEQIFDNDYHSHNVSGKVEFKSDLHPGSKANTLSLGVGSNLNSMFKSDEMSSQLIGVHTTIERDPQNNTYFVQPYAFVEYQGKSVHMKFTAELQHFRYDIKRMDEEYKVTSNDFTGQLITEWHFKPHKCLRFIADRKLERPSDEQLFPILNFDLEEMQYVWGNPYLTPMLSHELKLDYIADYKWDERSLIFNMGASYNNVSNIINSVQKGGSDSDSDSPLGATLKYLTFTNGGTNHIYNGNLMALYQHKAFTLSLSANIYHKDIDGNLKHHTYYNVSLHPQFTLNDGWHGGAKLTYYSKVHMHNGTLSDSAATSLSVGKRWKGIYVYVFDTIGLQKNARDVSTGADGSKTVNVYNMVPNTCGIGLKYTL